MGPAVAEPRHAPVIEPGRRHMNGPFAIANYAADVVAVVEALKLSAIHLAGASLGGSIGCAVAALLTGFIHRGPTP